MGYKRYLLVALLLLAFTGLAACNSGEELEEDIESAAEEDIDAPGVDEEGAEPDVDDASEDEDIDAAIGEEAEGEVEPGTGLEEETAVEGGDVESGGVEFGEDVEEDVEEGSVEEGGELGEVEVTAGVAGIVPTAVLETPESLASEEEAGIGEVEGAVVVGEEEDVDERPPFTSFETVAGDLAERGVTVEELELERELELAARGKRLQIEGEEVVILEFDSEAEAEAFGARLVEGDPAPEIQDMVTAETHVFWEDALLAVYTGGSEEVYGALGAVFGQELTAE